MLYMHREDIRLPNFQHFPDTCDPVELHSIQDVNIYNNFSDIVMSRDPIPENKVATALFKIVITSDCYRDEKEDTRMDLTALMI
jgi:hypothetical protein